MLNYGFIAAFSREFVLKGSCREYEIIKYSRELLPNSRCCTLESSQHYHENAPWMVPVGLQTHHSILT